uniref:Uncharacterized protein n=1 Tax=Brassica oleracea var. oleracea TaxID=109376 RepID=A0A0D3AMH5_BRAOL
MQVYSACLEGFGASALFSSSRKKRMVNRSLPSRILGWYQVVLLWLLSGMKWCVLEHLIKSVAWSSLLLNKDRSLMVLFFFSIYARASFFVQCLFCYDLDQIFVKS